jgi:hypothetical protein
VASDGINPPARGFYGSGGPAARLIMGVASGAPHMGGQVMGLGAFRMPAIATIASAGLTLAGCAVTQQAPLQPEYGYPQDWPQLVPLSTGLRELNGSYANPGIATSGDGKLVPIKLADLVPRTTPRKHASEDLDSGCADCVALRVLPAKSDSPQTLRLRFTLPPDSDRPGSPHEFDVASSGNANATQYTLQGFVDNAIVGFGYNATDVTVTCATDGSLIARIHNTSGVMVFLVIPVGSEKYTWARFERIGE